MSDAIVVKYCPACGLENLPNESFCTECDFDLLTVPSEPRRDLLESPLESATGDGSTALGSRPAPDEPRDFCRLELLEDSSVSFHVKPGQSVGRGVEADVLLSGVPHLTYISRRHAEFSKRGSQWFVQYVASGNFIKVDGETVTDDSLVALHDGSILVLSLSTFRVVLQ
jgi:pSer/pThr/pTyr-binding forkhead associated (FHA) protein